MEWSDIGVKTRSKACGGRGESTEEAIVRSLFEGIRVRDESLPTPGFYGRVLTQIGACQRGSIWMALIDSRSHSRLRNSFLCISLIVLGYTLAIDWNIDTAAGALKAVSGALDVQQQRDAVLTQIASYNRSR
jgi:hypothetical protein